MWRLPIVILGLLLSLFNVNAQNEQVYHDPAGRFSVVIGAAFEPIVLTETYGQFQLVTVPAVVTLTAVQLTDAVQSTEDAVRLGFEQIALPDVALVAGAGQGGWDLFVFEVSDGQNAAAAARMNGDSVAILLLTGDQTTVNTPPFEVMALLERFEFSGQESRLPTTVEAFETLIAEWSERDNVSISVAISINGQPVYGAGFGSVDGLETVNSDADTVYQWGSSTKIITATAIMQLWEQGLLDLDAPISEYLDYFPAAFGITPRHLLTHSSGLPEFPDTTQYVSLNDGEQLDPAVIARAYAAQLTVLDFPPASKVSYSNYGFLLLGEIVHEVSGLAYVDYVRQNILHPLGMTHTDFVYSPEMLVNAVVPSDSLGQEGYLRAVLGDSFTEALIARAEGDTLWFNPYNVLPPWGGLHGSVSEQLTLLNLHLNGGELNGVRLLHPDTVALMQEIQVGTLGSGWGLGWHSVEILDHIAFGHQGGGAGISMEMQLFPTEGIAITVMTNRTGYNASAVIESALNVVLSL